MILLFALNILTSSETCTIYGGPRLSMITDTNSQCINVVDSYFYNLAGFFTSSISGAVSITHSVFYQVQKDNSEVTISNANSIYFGECYFKKSNEQSTAKPALSCNAASTGTINFNVSTIQSTTRQHDLSCTAGQSFTSSNGNISFVDVTNGYYDNDITGVDLYITIPFTINYMTDLEGLYGKENGLSFGNTGTVSNTNIVNSIVWQTGNLIKCNSNSITWTNTRIMNIILYDTSKLFDSLDSSTFVNCFYSYNSKSSSSNRGISKSGLSLTTDTYVSPNMHLMMAGCAASKKYIYEEFPVPTRSPYPPCPPQEVKPKPKRPLRRVISSGASLAMSQSI